MAKDQDKYGRFKELTFEGFRALAKDDTLSRYEKIGFPDSYRDGYEPGIFRDIRGKLTNLGLDDQVVLDIGPGCSELPRQIVALCRERHHRLVLIDSPEMLGLLPRESFIEKIPGRFPEDSAAATSEFTGKINALLCYSVLHYIFAESNLFAFLDAALALLAPGGQLLLGDIPNGSKRRRLFSSAAGIRLHQRFTGTDEIPRVMYNQLNPGEIDDAVIVSILLRCRGAGFDAYVVPQAEDLPMANRREDILITRP